MDGFGLLRGGVTLCAVDGSNDDSTVSVEFVYA